MILVGEIVLAGKLKRRKDMVVDLTVVVGIWLGHERHGFDYANADKVAEQIEMVRRTVLRFRDHPALLMWALPQRRGGRVHTRKREGDGSRAWTAYIATISPNAYVIDLDDEHVTLHDLVMHRRSESPA